MLDFWLRLMARMSSAKGGSTLPYTVVAHFQVASQAIQPEAPFWDPVLSEYAYLGVAKTSQSCTTDKQNSAEVRRGGANSAKDATANTGKPKSSTNDLRNPCMLPKWLYMNKTKNPKELTKLAQYCHVGPMMLQHLNAATWVRFHAWPENDSDSTDLFYMHASIYTSKLQPLLSYHD